MDRSEPRRHVPVVGGNLAQCSAFSGGVSTFYAADGVAWPYSDEVTAGVETQSRRGIRLGAMFYYRTNRDQFGQRNTAVPTSAYTPFTFTVPNGPGGTVTSPKPMTVTAYNLRPSLASAQNNIRDNDPFLDTRLQGRRVHGHQALLAEAGRWWPGFTIGKNKGGTCHQRQRLQRSERHAAIRRASSATTLRSRSVCRAPTSCRRTSGSGGRADLNSGYPYQSTFTITRAPAAAAGVAPDSRDPDGFLSERGDERFARA